MDWYRCGAFNFSKAHAAQPTQKIAQSIQAHSKFDLNKPNPSSLWEFKSMQSMSMKLREKASPIQTKVQLTNEKFIFFSLFLPQIISYVCTLLPNVYS